MRAILPIINDMPAAESATLTDPLRLVTFHRNSDGTLIGALPCPTPNHSTVRVYPEQKHPERWAASMGGLVMSGCRGRKGALWMASALCLIHLSGRQYDHADEAAEDATAILLHLELER